MSATDELKGMTGEQLPFLEKNSGFSDTVIPFGFRNSRRDQKSEASYGIYGAAALDKDVEGTLRVCLRKIHAWRRPPHWSFTDWWREVDAQAHADAWRAKVDFDPSRGVPCACFTYSRVMTGMLTRYRQEWRYGLHNFAEVVNLDEQEKSAADPAQEVMSSDLLDCALLHLTESDKSFIEDLFWGDSTEEQLADSRGITRQAVNKRKRKILRRLRGELGEETNAAPDSSPMLRQPASADQNTGC